MLKVIYVCLEYKCSVGGTACLADYINELSASLGGSSQVNSIVTPHYDFYAYSNDELETVAVISHTITGKIYQSVVSRKERQFTDGKTAHHYLIRPYRESTENHLFDLHDQSKIYSCTSRSNLLQRAEYFNNAVAAMLMIENNSLPQFDIVHLQNHDTSAVAKIVKKFEKHDADMQIRRIPHIILTLHNLTLSNNLAESFEYVDAVHFAVPPVESAFANKTLGLHDVCMSLNDQGKIYSTCWFPSANCIEKMYERVIQEQVVKCNVQNTKVKDKIIPKTNTLINYSSNVMHVAIEFGAASFGGLGSVATQMVDGQNRLSINNRSKYTGSIITPYYPLLYKAYKDIEVVSQVSHKYNNHLVKANILLANHNGTAHYMVAPVDTCTEFFMFEEVTGIYADNYDTLLIDRIKYFNSAVAAYVNDIENGLQHPKPMILILHDWQAALVAKLLASYYVNNYIKTVYILHIGHYDRGSYSSAQLQGVGIKFDGNIQILKKIGIECADKVVGVSPSFTKECMHTRTDVFEIELIRKALVSASISYNKVIGIMNGINVRNYSPLGSLIPDLDSIYSSKYKIKRFIFKELSTANHSWSMECNLPVIFHVGRYADGKGIETFQQVIRAISGKAVFFALGRGLTDGIEKVINQHSLKTDNIFISCNEEDQIRFGKLMRACADFFYVPSHDEACGLVPIEGFAAGAMCITTGAGGLKDSVKPLLFSSNNQSTGNGFIYEDRFDGEENHSLNSTLEYALKTWGDLSDHDKNLVQRRIMEEANDFDWCAPNGALAKYEALFDGLVVNQQAQRLVRNF